MKPIGANGAIRVMAIDPGGISGVATAVLSGVRGLARREEDVKATMKLLHVPTVQEDFSSLKLFDEIAWWSPDVLIMEDFRLFPDVPHNPDPVGTLPDRLLARLDLMLYVWENYGIKMTRHGGVHEGERGSGDDCPRVFKQMPGERNAIRDEWLREKEMWLTPSQIEGSVKGKKGDHATQALKHLLVWCRKLEKGKVKV